MQKTSNKDGNNYFIEDFDVDESGRHLRYRFRFLPSTAHMWSAAVNLKGQEWTKKLEEFWTRDEETRHKRRHLENPYGYDPVDPPPFGRIIQKAVFVRDREIRFDCRYFARQSPVSADNDD